MEGKFYEEVTLKTKMMTVVVGVIINSSSKIRSNETKQQDNTASVHIVRSAVDRVIYLT